jgi:hypothetical protein
MAGNIDTALSHPQGTLPGPYRFELETDTQVTVAWTPSWALGGKALKVLLGLENS